MNTYTVYLSHGMRAVIHGSTLQEAMQHFRRPMECISYYRHGRDDSMYFDTSKQQWLVKQLEEAQVD